MQSTTAPDHHAAKQSLRLLQGPCRGDRRSVSTRPIWSSAENLRASAPLWPNQKPSNTAPSSHSATPKGPKTWGQCGGLQRRSRGLTGGSPLCGKKSLCPLRLCGQRKTCTVPANLPSPPKNPYTFYKDLVGATYQVARNIPSTITSKSVGATGGQCRRSVSTRPTRPLWQKIPVPQ